MATGMSYERLLDGQIFRIFERSTGQTIHVRAPIYFHDDFGGADLVVPAAGSDESGCKWVKEIAGAGTAVKQIDLEGGGIICATTAVTDTIIAGVCMDDINPYHPGVSVATQTGLQVEFRIIYTCASVTNQDMFVGLIGDYSESSTVLDSTERIGFFFDAALTPLCVSEDGTNSGSATSGQLFVTAVAHVLRIDLTDPTDCKFYIDGVRKAAGTTFTMEDITTERLQPFFGVFNNGTAGSNAVTVACTDCKIWQAYA